MGKVNAGNDGKDSKDLKFKLGGGIGRSKAGAHHRKVLEQLKIKVGAAAIQTQQSHTRTFKNDSDSSNSGDCAHTFEGSDSDSDDDSDAVIARRRRLWRINRRKSHPQKISPKYHSHNRRKAQQPRPSKSRKRNPRSTSDARIATVSTTVWRIVLTRAIATVTATRISKSGTRTFRAMLSMQAGQAVNQVRA